jgi:hypothetical protein
VPNWGKHFDHITDHFSGEQNPAGPDPRLSRSRIHTYPPGHTSSIQCKWTINLCHQITIVCHPPNHEYDDCEQQPRLGGCHNLRPMINVLFQMRESMLYQLQSHLNTTYGMVDNLQAETRNARAASWVPT